MSVIRPRPAAASVRGVGAQVQRADVAAEPAAGSRRAGRCGRRSAASWPAPCRRRALRAESCPWSGPGRWAAMPRPAPHRRPRTHTHSRTNPLEPGARCQLARGGPGAQASSRSAALRWLTPARRPGPPARCARPEPVIRRGDASGPRRPRSTSWLARSRRQRARRRGGPGQDVGVGVGIADQDVGRRQRPGGAQGQRGRPGRAASMYCTRAGQAWGCRTGPPAAAPSRRPCRRPARASAAGPVSAARRKARRAAASGRAARTSSCMMRNRRDLAGRASGTRASMSCAQHGRQHGRGRRRCRWRATTSPRSITAGVVKSQSAGPVDDVDRHVLAAAGGVGRGRGEARRRLGRPRRPGSHRRRPAGPAASPRQPHRPGPASLRTAAPWPPPPRPRPAMTTERPASGKKAGKASMPLLQRS